MVLVDGKKIAQEIYAEVKVAVQERGESPLLLVYTCNPNLETVRYLELKTAKAKALGIKLEVIALKDTTTTDEVIAEIAQSAQNCQGILVQLPLPSHLDTEKIITSVPKERDVDAFSYAGEETDILPPVIGAIAEIIKVHELNLTGKMVVIFGAGRLVGKPAAVFAKSSGAKVQVIDRDLSSEEVLEQTKEADFIILGVGKPGLLTGDMIKPGAVVFDAGASEDGGVLVGDAEVSVADKAGLLSPVPGGIGPITVAILFRNLVNLMNRQ